MWPLFLAHHHPEDAHRCVWLGRLPLCRRCTALWPICFATLVVCFARNLGPAQSPEMLAWLLLPVLEFIGVQLGRLPYRPGRVWLWGAIAGIGAGRLFHRYLSDPTDKTTWVIALSLGIPAAFAVLYQETGKKPDGL